jgi:hypothetical protein
MKQRPFVIVALTLSLYAVPANVPAANQKKLADALLKRASDLSDIRAEGAPHFRLEASVHLFIKEDDQAEGRYVTDWQSPAQWRDELTFPGYHQIREGTVGGIWRSRNPPHQTLAAVQFLQSFLVSGPPSSFVSKHVSVSMSEHGRAQLNCVMLDFGRGMEDAREKCFDPVSGLLFRETWNDWDTVWEYTDYAPWGAKIFPRLMRTFQGGKLVSEARITRLEVNPNLDLSTYVPPQDAEMWPSCAEEIRPPSKLFQDQSIMNYSNVIYRSPTSIFLEIGADGHVEDVVIVYDGYKTESEYSHVVEELKRAWKFKPAHCGKVPIPVAMTFETAPSVGIIR